MPVKKESKATNKKTVIVSKAKQSTKINKIATLRQAQGKLPRNDKRVSTRAVSLTIPVYSLAGRASGTLSLPKEIFGAKVNKKLLSQAMRVYMTNQRTLLGSTKTRGEVEGSTAKIYRQKGTGRARHGSVRAPIFVGGGITFGPQSRKKRLELPQRMRKAALISAFSSKRLEKSITGLTGMEKSSGKTKEMIDLLSKIAGKDKSRKSILILIDGKADNIVRAVRNIPLVNAVSADLVNAYEILRHDALFITKEAVEKLKGVAK